MVYRVLPIDAIVSINRSINLYIFVDYVHDEQLNV